ncbi:MAG: hypothetical protein JWQ10_1275 [Herbaspirillum sp.]|nr:hypothetical protein [Herbaspirillum sp.]
MNIIATGRPCSEAKKHSNRMISQAFNPGQAHTKTTRQFFAINLCVIRYIGFTTEVLQHVVD